MSTHIADRASPGLFAANDTGAELGAPRRDERLHLRYRKAMVSYLLVFLGAGIGRLTLVKALT